MKIQMKITPQHNFFPLRFWFGGDESSDDWEERIVILNKEIENGKVRIPQNHLEKGYISICRRLKLKFSF